MSPVGENEIDVKNSSFWTELCGSGFATALGIKDHAPSSLKEYDDSFFEYYPYLKKYISQLSLDGKTGLSSKTYLKEICKEFSDTQIVCKNWDGPFRKYFFNNIAHLQGLYLYVIAKK